MISSLLALIFISGAFAAETESVSGVEGDAVTLRSRLSDVQREDLILWTFGSQDHLIGEIHKQKVYLYDSGGSLEMEENTGSLSIRNLREEHAGLYGLTAINNGSTTRRSFNLTVHKAVRLPVPVISRISSSHRYCSVLCSVVNVSHVTLSWYKGNSSLSSISVSDLSISLSLPLEVEHQDTNTYRCVLNNPISHLTTHLDISHCRPCEGLCCSSTETVIRLVLSALVGVATVSIVVYDMS